MVVDAKSSVRERITNRKIALWLVPLPISNCAYECEERFTRSLHALALKLCESKAVCSRNEGCSRILIGFE